MLNYEKDAQIEEDALDLEWLDQPSLMMKYAIAAADARAELDRAKERLDIVVAQLDREIRAKPSKFGIDKVTEAVVEHTILLQPKRQEASNAVIKAKYESDMAYNAVKSIEARKDALENLVRLHGQQYFAGPKVPRDLGWERKERQKRSDAGVASRLKRNKRHFA